MRYLRFAALMSATAILVGSCTGQDSPPTPKSPHAIVQDYWKMEMNGGRLTDNGWTAANSFFVRPMPLPKERNVVVISDDFSIWDPIIKGSVAEVTIGIDPIWRIDSRMRISRFQDGESVKSGVLIKLVQTKVSSKLSEWKIEKAGSMIWLSKSAAIRYAREIDEKSEDVSIKRNVAETLSVLERK